MLLILEIKETFLATRAQKGSLRVKRGHHPIVGDVNLPIGLFSRIHLGLRDVHTQGGLWVKANTDSEPSKERWLAKRKHWRNDPNKWFKVPRGHGSLSEPALWVYSHVLFFLLINNLLVSLLSICLWKCISTQLQARALSLATGSHGLVARIQCSHCHGLTSISGLHSLARELKSCSKPLQAEATWEQRESQPWRLGWFHVFSMTCSIWPQQHVLKVGSSWASWPQYSGCSSSLPLRSSLICPPLKVSVLLGSILLSLSWLATEHEPSFSDVQPHTHCWNMCWAKAECGEGFFGGPVAKTSCSQCRGLTPDWGTRLNWTRTESSLATTKDSSCLDKMEDPACCT